MKAWRLERLRADLPAAMDAVATAGNFECAVVKLHN
jgi:hypothetical protein